MMVLFIMFIIFIHLVFGMDSLSEDPDLSNSEDVDFSEYTKQEPKVHDLYDEDKLIIYDQNHLLNEYSGVKCLSGESEEKFDETNILKRKHNQEKIRACEFCQKKNIRCKGKISGKSLCNACYKYERRHGYLILPDERKKHEKHKDHILVCEFCQKEADQYTTGKVSGKSLCRACYQYEYQHLYLVPRDERKNYRKNERKHKDILVCEVCQEESIKYIIGKASGKSVCQGCYMYEYENGYERKYHGKHDNNINVLECENCQIQNTKYIKGKFSGKSLCKACYMSEYRNGYLDEQKKTEKYKDRKLACRICQKENIKYKTEKFSGNSLCDECSSYKYRYGREKKHHEKHKDILECEVCKIKSTQYTKGKISGKSLCKTCYQYESRHGYERTYHGNHKNNILVCEGCQNEGIVYKRGKTSGKSLCNKCYIYESRHGHLVPPEERKKHNERAIKYKNLILECEVCQKESEKYLTGKVSGKAVCSACYLYESRTGHERNYCEKHKGNNNQHINTKKSTTENKDKPEEKIVNKKHLAEKENEHIESKHIIQEKV